MIVVKRFIANIIRPIIVVGSFNPNTRKVYYYNALVDTGAVHFVWCGSKQDMIDFGFIDLKLKTDITGLNDSESYTTEVYKGNLIIPESGSMKNKKIFAFDNLEIVHKKMLQEDFDMIIPFSFFGQFDTVLLKPTNEYNDSMDKNRRDDNQENIKFGALGLLTDDNDSRNVFSLSCINHKVVGLNTGDRNKFSILFEQ